MTDLRLTTWQVFKREGWSNRFLMIGGAFWLTMSTLTTALLLLIGVLGGGWQWTQIRASLACVVLGVIVVRYVYWRHRAIEAEKPLPPTQVIVTYSTAGAADIARRVEARRLLEQTEGVNR